MVAVLWLVFIAPPATVLALLQGAAFHAGWLSSLMFIPLPLVLLIVVFRSSSAGIRWWIFQYLGISAIGFSAALCGALLSLLIDHATAGWLAVCLFAMFLAVALYAAHRIHLTPLEIISPKIRRPQRLVQISDVHIGSRRAAWLRKVIDLVSAQQPDMLLITGDLIDENVSADSLLPLAGLDFPVFYCSGNHERYVDYSKALDIIAGHGVTVLSDTVAVVDDIHILGVEDRQHVQQAQEALNALCGSSESTDTAFRILLYHQPDLWSAAIQHGIDLMLSGHTHKGQIWPFGWLVRIRYAHVAGHFRKALSHLFVSQGTGTWGPILRFGTRCEMTVIELRPQVS
ncbi:metallophosphoesterase [Granulosicoccus sp. 3-233]|uniref:metallophosphoesterase n=1 Tax=Granulosicoccus sp. 3-233 TaxID=3417969 RepID=UPI003D34669A